MIIRAVARGWVGVAGLKPTGFKEVKMLFSGAVSILHAVIEFIADSE